MSKRWAWGKLRRSWRNSAFFSSLGKLLEDAVSLLNPFFLFRTHCTFDPGDGKPLRWQQLCAFPEDLDIPHLFGHYQNLKVDENVSLAAQKALEHAKLLEFAEEHIDWDQERLGKELRPIENDKRSARTAAKSC